MTDEEKQKVHDLVQDEILEKLEKARMEGIMIGYQVCCQQMYKDTKDIHNVKDMRKYLKDYAENMKSRLEEMAKVDEATDDV